MMVSIQPAYMRPPWLDRRGHRLDAEVWQVVDRNGEYFYWRATGVSVMCSATIRGSDDFASVAAAAWVSPVETCNCETTPAVRPPNPNINAQTQMTTGFMPRSFCKRRASAS